MTMCELSFMLWVYHNFYVILAIPIFSAFKNEEHAYVLDSV